MRFCNRQKSVCIAPRLPSVVISVLLLARVCRWNDESFVTPTRHLRQLRSVSKAAYDGQAQRDVWRPGPAEVRSLVGQKARQLLMENPTLFEVSLEEELPALSSDLATSVQDGTNHSDAAWASLRARIQEVQESDRGRSLSELMYLMVCAGFQRTGYTPVQSLQAGGRVDLGSLLLDEDALTSRIHAEEVLEAVEDHLTQSMPGGMASKNSQALQQTVLLPQFNLGQAYAMTIQYGYVLRRAQSRLQLERGLHPDAEGLDSLRSYLKRIGPGMFQDAMVSVEAHIAGKLQVEAVFGDLQMLKGQLMKAIESRRPSGRDTGAMLQEAVSAGEVASLLLGASDVRRLLLEAAAFGALLWESESKASELATLVPSKQPRLSDFGVEADGEGNPVIPE